MDYQTILQIAKSAGLGPENVSGLLQARLEVFARAVEKEAKAEEREACAKVCEGFSGVHRARVFNNELHRCAEAIRMRSNAN